MSQSNLLGYLVFDKVNIKEANGVSSPLTYGFPALTGFLGAVHALERKVKKDERLKPFSFGGVLVASHSCTPLVYRPHSYADYTFRLKRNPILRSGKTASIIEEGRVDLCVSLVVEVYGSNRSYAETPYLAQRSQILMQQQRIAGGRVEAFSGNSSSVSFCDEEEISGLRHRLAPGFILMDAASELEDIYSEMKNEREKTTKLDALLEIGVLHHQPPNEDHKNWTVKTCKRGRGWLVPIPVGYRGISKVMDGEDIENIRDPNHQAQYVETVYSCGRWVFPYRIDSLSDAFWHYGFDERKNLYFITQKGDY